MLEMLDGAMQALTVGDPWLLATDVGPVIDDEALTGIGAYCERMEAEGRLIARLAAPAGGRFVGAAHLPRFRHRRAGARGVRPGAACRHFRGGRDRPR